MSLRGALLASRGPARVVFLSFVVIPTVIIQRACVLARLQRLDSSSSLRRSELLCGCGAGLLRLAAPRNESLGGWTRLASRKTCLACFSALKCTICDVEGALKV